MKKYIRKTAKVLAWIFAGIILLLLMLYILVRIPAVQNYASGKLVNMLEKQTGAEISLERLLIEFPTTVSLQELFVGDARGDTILYAGNLGTNISIWGLLWNKIHISGFTLENSTVRITRSSTDSLFNFQFIIDSLSGAPKEPSPEDTSASSPDLSVGKVELRNIRFMYRDEVAGVNLENHSGSLEINMGGIDLETLHFEVHSLDYRNSGTRLVLLENALPPPDTSITESQPEPLPGITVGEILLENIGFTLIDSTSEEVFRLSYQEIHLDGDDLAMAGEAVTADRLRLKLADTTLIRLAGAVGGLTGNGSLQADLDIQEVSSDSADIRLLLPDSLIPQGFSIPAHVYLSGRLSGRMDDMEARLALRSSLGSLESELSLRWNEEDIPVYRGNIVIDTFNIGRLLNDTAMLGILGAKADFDGHGFDPQVLDSRLELELPFFEVNGYLYTNTLLNITASKGKYSLSGNIDDDYVKLSLEGDYIPHSRSPAVEMTLDVKAADLQQLNWSEEDIRVKGVLVADLQGSQTDNLTGKLFTRDVLIIRGDTRYPMDSLVFIAFNDSMRTDVTLRSHLLDARIDANRAFSALVPSVGSHLDRHLPINMGNGQERDTTLRMEFEATLKSSTLLKEVIAPGLQAFEEGRIKGSLENSIMKLQVDVPLVNYEGNVINGLNLSVQSGRENLSGDLSIRNVEAMGMHADSITLSLEARQDSVLTELTIKEGEGPPQYRITNSLVFTDTATLLAFTRDDLILNYKEWQVREDNYIMLGDFPVTSRNLSLHHEDEAITVSMQAGILTVELDRLRLDNLGSLLETPDGKAIIGGRTSGRVELVEQPQGSLLKADLNVDSLQVMGEMVGNIAVTVEQDTANNLSGSLRMTGPNRLTADIVRLPLSPGQEAEVDISMEELRLATAEPFLQEQVDSLEGSLKGSLRLRSTLDNPSVSGEIHFAGASAVIPFLGSRMTIPGTILTLSDNDLTFDEFTLRDRQNNGITLNGTIVTDSLQTFTLDLNVRADHFTAIDNTAQQNNIVFGRLTFSTDTDIRGLISQPEIRSRLVIEDETDLKFSIEQLKPPEAESEGIVEFVDMDSDLDTILVDREPATLAFEPAGISLSANIETRPGAYFELVIDERAGDRLRIHGSSDLTLSLNETGDLSMTGRYEVNGGNYRLILFNITRKEFEINEGSHLLWTGEPLGAAMEINATYHVRAAPINLIRNQSIEADSPEFAKYKQKLPFRVNLRIRGSLLSPEISFSIELPPDLRGIHQGTIQARLQQLNQPGNESSLNKQVLSLLVFNQFMPQDPLDMEGGGVTSTARQSVSKLLSRQLNIFADKYIQGVDLTFDVRSYEEYTAEGAPEGRTELGLTLSRSFLDDRLEVRVGGNVELESEEYRRETGFNDIAGDIELIYKLTENGVYRVKAFRLNEYEQFEGTIVESGVSLIFTRRFDSAQEIFRPEQKRQQKKEKKEEKKK